MADKSDSTSPKTIDYDNTTNCLENCLLNQWMEILWLNLWETVIDRRLSQIEDVSKDQE